MEPFEAAIERERLEMAEFKFHNGYVEVILPGVSIMVPIHHIAVDRSRKPKLILEIPICPPSTSTNPTNTPSS